MKRLTEGENISKENMTFSNIEKIKEYQKIYDACMMNIETLLQKHMNEYHEQHFQNHLKTKDKL